jgi:hypothetical protein
MSSLRAPSRRRDDPLHQSDVRGIAQLVEATTINADLLAFFEE